MKGNLKELIKKPDAEHSGHEHEHSHDHACGVDDCCQKPDVGEKLLVLRVAASAVLFLVGLLVPLPEAAKAVIYAVSVLTAGYDIIFQAFKSLITRFEIDENLLMTLAAIGAFAIGEYGEGAAVMLLFRIGEMLQERAVERSRGSIAGLMDLRPETVSLMKNGELVTVPPEDAHIGDTMLVSPGERVPLDGVVLTGVSALDLSALTGESAPRDIAPGGELMSGSINLSDVLTARVTAEAGDSTAARILKLVESAEGYRAKPERAISKFAKKYTPAVIILAVIIGVLVPLFGGLPFADWLHRALTFLVIACPCALVISVPLTYFAGIGGASRRGILFKGADVIDIAADAASVVFDKTGTLTTGTFRVTETYPVGVSREKLLELAAYAESFSNHPMAKSIIEASGITPDKSLVLKYHEQRGMGVVIELKGGVIVAAGSAGLMRKLGITPEEADVNDSVVHVAAGGRYAGYIAMGDTVKADSAEAIKALRALNIERVAIFTGDKQEAARAVAEKLDISEVYAECLPEDKTRRLTNLRDMQLEGDRLVFVGDGINDAPVIALADVGVAMGGVGSDAAIEAASIVLMTDEPSKVAEAVSIARATRKIVRQNIVFALLCKLVIMVLGVCGIASMWLAVFADVGVALLAIMNAMRAYGVKSVKNSAERGQAEA